MNNLNEKRALEINSLVETFKSGDMETVIIKSKELIKKYPTSATIFNLFALANKNIGNFQIAIDLYKELLINNPENPMFLTNLANIYKDQGNWAKAEKYLKKALDTPHNTENTYISLGNLYSQQNRSDECIEFFEKLLINNSIKEDKNISELYFNLAESYRKKGLSFYDKAIEYYNLSNQPMTTTHGLECVYKTKDKEVFYKELGNQGIKAEDIPVVAFSVGEEELSGLDTSNLVGHLAAWNYFQSAESDINSKFIKAWKARMGNKRVTNDPMEAHYIGFNMWVNAVKQAGTTNVDAVRTAMYGQKFPNLTGGTAEMLTNHHLSKPVLIGEIKADGQFDIISKTEPVPGDAWTDFLAESAVLKSDWKGLGCGMYNTNTKTCIQLKSNY